MTQRNSEENDIKIANPEQTKPKSFYNQWVEDYF